MKYTIRKVLNPNWPDCQLKHVWMASWSYGWKIFVTWREAIDWATDGRSPLMKWSTSKALFGQTQEVRHNLVAYGEPSMARGYYW